MTICYGGPFRQAAGESDGAAMANGGRAVMSAFAPPARKPSNPFRNERKWQALQQALDGAFGNAAVLIAAACYDRATPSAREGQRGSAKRKASIPVKIQQDQLRWKKVHRPGEGVARVAVPVRPTAPIAITNDKVDRLTRHRGAREPGAQRHPAPPFN